MDADILQPQPPAQQAAPQSNPFPPDDPRYAAYDTARQAIVNLNKSIIDLGPVELNALARDLASKSSSDNTIRAYEADWNHYLAWCEMTSTSPLPPHPAKIANYMADQVHGKHGATKRKLAVSSITRRLTGLNWYLTLFGFRIDRKDADFALVFAGLKRTHGRPPAEKEAVLTDELKAMLAQLAPGTLVGLRDKAILLIGFCGGLRRSEIVGLDYAEGQTADGTGWITFLEQGLLLTIKGKTGWREVEVSPSENPQYCPIHALANWLQLAKVSHGPVFRRLTKVGVTADRLAARRVAAIVKRTAEAARIRPNMSTAEREKAFAAHSLRAGFATEAAVDANIVQKQLGHSDPKMTQRYKRRRGRFRVNLTKALGL